MLASVPSATAAYAVGFVATNLIADILKLRMVRALPNSVMAG